MAVVTKSPRTPELRIVPEPPARDREAIVHALARVQALPRPPVGRTAWWRKGVRESVAPAAFPRPRPPS